MWTNFIWVLWKFLPIREVRSSRSVRRRRLWKEFRRNISLELTCRTPKVSDKSLYSVMNRYHRSFCLANRMREMHPFMWVKLDTLILRYRKDNVDLCVSFYRSPRNKGGGSCVVYINSCEIMGFHHLFSKKSVKNGHLFLYVFPVEDKEMICIFNLI